MRNLAGRLGISVAIVAAGAGAGAFAQDRKCEIAAHVIDRDPKGVNIRNAPSDKGKIVGVMKFQNAEDEIQVDIVAESNGWFRIKEYDHLGVTKTVKLAGWVHGSRLGTGLKLMDVGKGKERVFEEPSPRSKTLLEFAWDPGADENKKAELWAELPGGKREKIDFENKKGAATPTLLACANGYVKIRMNQKYEGWLPAERLCGSPVTTCP